MNSDRSTAANSNSSQLGQIGERFASDEEVIDLSQYWRTIMRRKWGILCIVIICTMIGVYAAISATPIYRASASIKADPSPPAASREEQYISSALVFLYYETQYEIIKSRVIAGSVVDKLGLVEKFKIKQAKEEKEQGSTISLVDKLQDWLPTTSLELVEEEDKVVTDETYRTNIALGIQGTLEVSGGKQSQIINISYDAPNAQEAADVVNAVSDAYIQFGLSSRLGQIEKTTGWLSEQLEDLKAKLRDSEQRLQAYREQEGMVDSGQQQRIADTQLQTLNSELVKAQTRESEARILFRQVDDLKDQPEQFNSLSSVLNSKTIQDMVREDSRLNRKVEELSKRYGEKHPKMIAARSELTSSKENLKNEVEKIARSIEKQYRSSRVQVNNIKALINTQKQSLGSLQGANFALTSLEREVENNRRVYESFLSKLMQSDISGQNDTSNVQIIDTAAVPAAPYKPNKKLFIVLGAFMGLFLGVVLAFLREALDNTFKTPGDLEEKLNTAALGITQLVSNKKGGSPADQYLSNNRSPFAESINNIRTGLLFSNIDKPPQTVLITSASGSEGKSTLAINLATAFSQLDRTLLLEVDLRKPSIARYTHSNNPLGLCDVVAGHSKLEDAIHIGAGQSPAEREFHIMSCGTIPPNPLELLSSERFEEVLAGLRGHYRYIVMDGPPTLPVSDSTVIGHLADATILTVKADSTPIKAAQSALARLKNLGITVTGAVLSQATQQSMNNYGDHYYAGDYYGNDDENNAEADSNKHSPGASA